MGQVNKKTHPLKKQGWDTKSLYSTVPPWLLCKTKPLIDALTGAPGGPFPVRGSEVVSARPGNRSLSAPWASSLRIFSGDMSSSLPLINEKIAHFLRKVKGKSKGRHRRRGKLPSGQHNTLETEKHRRLHKSTPYVNKCNFLTQDIGGFLPGTSISCVAVDIISRT